MCMCVYKCACEGVSRLGRRTYPPSQRLGTRTEQKEKANGEPVLVSLCLLTAEAVWLAILLLWLCHPRNGPYSQTVSPKPTFLSLGAFVMWFATVTRQLAPQPSYTRLSFGCRQSQVFASIQRPKQRLWHWTRDIWLSQKQHLLNPLHTCSYSRLISRQHLLRTLTPPKLS